MSKNRKLRLLVTTRCPNKCEKCCNKQYNIDAILLIDSLDYDEISITGGEPLIDGKMVYDVTDIVKSMKSMQKMFGLKVSKYWLYTAVDEPDSIAYAVQVFDGVVFTPHNEQSVRALYQYTSKMCYNRSLQGKSMRLNLFPEIERMIYEIDNKLKYERSVIYPYQFKNADGVSGIVNVNMQKIFNNWQVKSMKWLDECPVPEGEDFRRIDKLL